MYFKLYLTLRNEILLGELPPGSRIPNIFQLHQRFGVSEGTVRTALDLLAKEGFIVKKRGSGTYIKDDVARLAWTPKSFYKEFKDAVKLQRIEQIAAHWVDPPNRVRNLVQGQQDALREGKIFFTRRIFISRRDSRRRNLWDIYIPGGIFDRLNLDRLSVASILDAVIELQRNKKVRILQTIRPWICDSETAKLLDLVEGIPLFHRAWNVVDNTGRTLYYSEWLTTALALVREIAVTDL